MKKVVIIGANDFQNPLILKAKELGYETHVFAWKDGSIGEKTADYFYPISIVEKDKILKECKKIKPQAIASIGSDLASITVNYLAYELGLPCNNPKYSEQCTNKYEMRKVFLENGVVVPQFVKLGKDDEVILNEFEFPVIVKPTDRSGSRGIFLCKNIEEVKESELIELITKNIDNPNYISVSIDSEQIEVKITKEIKTAIGKVFNLQLAEVNTHYKGKKIEDKKEIERIK